jgi:uncharacterized protein YbjT (DUF2867 family)
MSKLLILGGSGFVGRSVCEHWAKHHASEGSLTVPTRQLVSAQASQSLPGVSVVQADVQDAAQLARLVEGQDIVINLIAILHGSQAEFDRVHVQLPQKLASACERAGVRRLIHVSALGAEGGAAAPSMYLRSKAAGEAVLARAPLDLTILRPSVIFGERDRFLNLFARLQSIFPVMPLAGAQAQFQPVWVEDVAAAILRCCQDPMTIGKIYEAAGPDVLTLGDLVRLAGRVSGHARPVLPLPQAIAWLQALAMEFAPGEPLMSRDNLASMRSPNVANASLPGLAALGVTASSVASIVPTYLPSRRQ